MNIDIHKLLDVIKQKGYTKAYISKHMNIGYTTFYRKLKNGGRNFSAQEINRLIDILSLSKEEAISIFLNFDSTKKGE